MGRYFNPDNQFMAPTNPAEESYTNAGNPSQDIDFSRHDAAMRRPSDRSIENNRKKYALADVRIQLANRFINMDKNVIDEYIESYLCDGEELISAEQINFLIATISKLES